MNLGVVPRDSFEPITEEEWAELRSRYPDAERLLAAFRLALDVEACADLLAGRAVDPARLDPVELAAARERTLVQLVAPLDLLPKEAE